MRDPWGMFFLNARPAIAISGFAADDNPNKTPPTADKILSFSERIQTGSKPSDGVMLVAVFSATSPAGTFEADNAAAQVSFTLWVQDAQTTTAWYRVTADTAIHRLLKITADIRGGGKVFVQVTAISGSVGADFVTIKVRET